MKVFGDYPGLYMIVWPWYQGATKTYYGQSDNVSRRLRAHREGDPTTARWFKRLGQPSEVWSAPCSSNEIERRRLEAALLRQAEIRDGRERIANRSMERNALCGVDTDAWVRRVESEMDWEPCILPLRGHSRGIALACYAGVCKARRVMPRRQRWWRPEHMTCAHEIPGASLHAEILLSTHPPELLQGEML